MTGHLPPPAARADLSGIWNRTARNRGRIRPIATSLPSGMLANRDACSALANGSKSGSAVDDARPGCRKPAVLPRCMFYRVNDADPIEVMRILHQRMDVAVHPGN